MSITNTNINYVSIFSSSFSIGEASAQALAFSPREKKLVPFGAAIENVKLMYKSCPQHLRMRTEMTKFDN